MLDINYEFRKGIFFIRLIGEMNDKKYHNVKANLEELISINKFRYIVLNTNNINKIDLEGLKYILEIYQTSKKADSQLIICDKSNIINKLFLGLMPSIKDESEVL